MAYDGGLCVYSRQVHRVTDGHIQKKNKSHNVSVHITHNIWPMCTTYSTTPYRSHSRNFSYFFEVHERNTDSVFFGFYTWSWLGWWSPSNSPADSLNCYQIIFVVVVVLQAVFHCVASSAGFGLVSGRKTLFFRNMFEYSDQFKNRGPWLRETKLQIYASGRPRNYFDYI